MPLGQDGNDHSGPEPATDAGQSPQSRQANKAGVAVPFMLEERPTASIPCRRGDADVFPPECNSLPSNRLFESITASSQING
jgi:hypothetical protein